MKTLFPADLRDPERTGKPNVQTFLIQNFLKEYELGAPPPEVRGPVERLMTYLDGEKPWAVVYDESISPPTLYSVAKWLAIAYACTKEKRAIHTSYSDLVDSIRSGSELADLARQRTFLILLFPEMVQNADWARAKVLDMLLQKKHVVVMTMNPRDAGAVLGEIIIKTIQSCAGQDTISF
jgi:hypothetical protein